ncbi:MAG: NTP transferase domain-containing protein [Planctomycetota bacterium]
MNRAGTVVVLAAGQGTRMKSAKPKVLHEICGRAMLGWVLDQAFTLEPQRVLLVVGHGADQIHAFLEAEGLKDKVTCVVQEPQNGTGHALQVCLPEFGEDPGRVVVLYGDMPALRSESLFALCDAADDAGADGAAILTCVMDEPRGFGRIVRSDGGIGALEAIVEEKDCSEEQRAIAECNLGVYAFPGPALLAELPKLSNDNAQGEYYLTDVVGAITSKNPGSVHAVPIEDAEEALGVNTLAHLAEARWAIQVRLLEEHLANGVQIEDPGSTYIDWGVEIGTGTRVLPCTVIRRGVTVGENCEVGPFTHLRVGTVLKDGAEVGNFTECKKSTVGARSKAKHLSYLGDVTIGERTNIGAGTIFANYDGTHKHKSVVGDNAFVGSGTIVVAPNEIGDGATTGAGAVVTKNVPGGRTVLGVPAKPHDRSPAK